MDDFAISFNSMIIELYADNFQIKAPYRIRKPDVKLDSIKKGKSRLPGLPISVGIFFGNLKDFSRLIYS